MASESAETRQHLHTLTLKVCLLYIKQLKISNNQTYSTNLLQLLHRDNRVASQECKTTQGTSVNLDVCCASVLHITLRKHPSVMNGLTGVQKVGLVLHDSTRMSSESSLQFPAQNEEKCSLKLALGAENHKLST